MTTILDIALQREKEAQNYYLQIADKCPDAGLEQICRRLAEVEAKHYEVIKRMQAEGDVGLVVDDYREELKTVFDGMSRRAGSFDFGIAQLDMYKHAQQREEEAQEFYLNKAAEVGTAEGEELFNKLAAQEKRHYQILATIIDFVSHAEPGNWLENAEWYHADEY